MLWYPIIFTGSLQGRITTQGVPCNLYREGVCSVWYSDYKAKWSNGFLYHTCTIICSSFYIYYLLFEDHFLFSRRFFEKVMSLYGASIQEGFIIKSGLRWHAYSICFESAAFLDKKKNVFRKNFNSLRFATLKKYASVPRSKIRQLTGILFTRIVCITHFSHAFTPWGPYIYAINIFIFYLSETK